MEYLNGDDCPVYMGENDSTLPCRLCGEESRDCKEYAMIHREAQVCSKCASIISNVFSMKHSGEYLTWPNQPHLERYRPRKTIKPIIKKQVMERDRYRCVKCESFIDLQIDHIYPHSKGGSDEIDNLQTLCKLCNARKRDRIEVAA